MIAAARYKKFGILLVFFITQPRISKTSDYGSFPNLGLMALLLPNGD